MREVINILKVVKMDKPYYGQDGEIRYSIYGHWKIWVLENIDIIPEENRIYELKSSKGKDIEGEISEVGKDSLGNYFILNIIGGEICERSEPFKLPSITIPKGEMIIREVFHPHYIQDYKESQDEFTGKIMGIRDCILDFEKKDNNMILKLREGSLGDNIITLELRKVYKEEYLVEGCKGLEYFMDGNIGKLYIRKNEVHGYKVILEKIDFISEPEVPVYYSDSDIEPEKVQKVIDGLSKKCHPAFSKVQKSIGVIYCEEIRGEKSNYFLDILKENGIIYTAYNDEAEEERVREFKKEWYKRIIGDTCVDKIYIDQFLWHIFSFEKLPCYVGEEANERFNKANKEAIFIFFQHDDKGYFMKSANGLRAEHIRIYDDVYVTAEDFSWTYVCTHEKDMCGPYFYENSRNK